VFQISRYNRNIRMFSMLSRNVTFSIVRVVFFVSIDILSDETIERNVRSLLSARQYIEQMR